MNLHKFPRNIIIHLGLLTMQLLKKLISQPEEAVIEKVYFKYNYKKFVVQYIPSKPEEKTLWAIQLRDGTPYYLGKYSAGKLIAPPYNELSRHNDWSVLKGATRLYNWIEYGKGMANSDVNL